MLTDFTAMKKPNIHTHRDTHACTTSRSAHPQCVYAIIQFCLLLMGNNCYLVGWVCVCTQVNFIKIKSMQFEIKAIAQIKHAA